MYMQYWQQWIFWCTGSGMKEHVPVGHVTGGYGMGSPVLGNLKVIADVHLCNLIVYMHIKPAGLVSFKRRNTTTSW